MTHAKDSKRRSTPAWLKEARARDSVLAVREYEAEQQAVLARTAKLRAMRLAKEAETSARKGESTGKTKKQMTKAR